MISRPANADELLNLHHASARNVIEHLFSVLKRCFRILVYPLEVDINYQANLPAALAAIHNFICVHDPEELASFQEAQDWQLGMAGELATGEARAVERAQANARCDNIANAMWAQYQVEIQQRAMDV